MNDAGAGAMGWTSLNSTFALAVGFLVCIILIHFIAKPLADRGRERYVFWIFLGSLVLVTGVSFMVLSQHHTDKAVFIAPDNPNTAK